jgi:hypothetical protein
MSERGFIGAASRSTFTGAREIALPDIIESFAMVIHTVEQKLRALEREIRLRERVYPNRIETKRMSPEKAAYELEIMRQIAEDYRKWLGEERLL